MNTVTAPQTATTITLAEAAECIWLEADLLDGRDYAAWLDLWTPTGLYIVPTDREATDHAATLNYAYDDAVMRKMRVERLTSGHAISSAPAALTVRTVSRFRVVEATASAITVRCALHLVDYKFERQRTWAADLAYRLTRSPDGLKIEEKVVRLINAGDALSALSYLL